LSGRLPALIFDCDGVLVDSEHLASRVETEVARDLGLSLTVDEAHALFLGKTVDGVLDAVAVRSGRRPGAAFVYNWAFATAHAFLRELRPVPGVRAAAEELRRRGHAMAVASQSPLARVKMSLDVTGFGDWFGEHVYVTSMVPRPKPAPDIYLLAARSLGVAPGDCLVIEDSPAGARAARGAGFRVIGYVPEGVPDEVLEDMEGSGATVIRGMGGLVGAVENSRRAEKE
jgi:HAD superfamily hydrolase (TIGR01509 family)